MNINLLKHCLISESMCHTVHFLQLCNLGEWFVIFLATSLTVNGEVF